MSKLPLFDVPTRNGIPVGPGAVAAAAATKRERLDPQDLPNAPSAPRPT